ncbi:MAG TPA: glutathione S-transferase family protein [Caulobacteraceae bacterium]|jgi:glutathione S-transferase|nr:glutathione S-transferase family protein [Caulobacteraceae bacterium]
MSIIIYHAEARRSERIAWLLEELDRPYELVFKPGDVVGSFDPLRETGHPFPMAPVVQDGEDLMIESGAIIETLLNRHGDGRLRPAAGSKEHVRYLEWLHFAESTAWPRIQQEFINRALPPAKTPEAQARRFGGSARVLKYYEVTLADRPFLAGPDFSAADIQNHFVIRLGLSAAAGRRGVPSQLLQPDAECYAPYPAVAGYMQRLGARPAFKRMMSVTMPQGWPAI